MHELYLTGREPQRPYLGLGFGSFEPGRATFCSAYRDVRVERTALSLEAELLQRAPN